MFPRDGGPCVLVLLDETCGSSGLHACHSSIPSIGSGPTAERSDLRRPLSRIRCKLTGPSRRRYDVEEDCGIHCLTDCYPSLW
ncbi:unnamed protein product [Periconia digitata]|uniref:Uncharacterized protein n=1 Tax=Periconia digitata TaxID=1303443 RepID=A0A9W4U7D2_9PLEO|nr:unnamed protein product [Periconia digitata]